MAKILFGTTHARSTKLIYAISFFFSPKRRSHRLFTAEYQDLHLKECLYCKESQKDEDDCPYCEEELLIPPESLHSHAHQHSHDPSEGGHKCE